MLQHRDSRTASELLQHRNLRRPHVALCACLTCAVGRRRFSSGANPARQLSPQPVAIQAVRGGDDTDQSTSMKKGRLGWFSERAGTTPIDLCRLNRRCDTLLNRLSLVSML